MNSHSLKGADGVRALACLMVMAHHAAQRLDFRQVPWLQEAQAWLLTGAAGVGVFFVLSGYLLSSPFWRAWNEGLPSPSLRTFALRRWARIAPAFWVNLVLTFVLSLTFVPDAPERVWRFVAGLTFTSSLAWQTFFPVEINGPLWSIGFEVFSYTLLALFLALWFAAVRRRSWGAGMRWWVLVFALAVLGHLALLAWSQTDPVGKGWQYGMFGGAKYWWPAYNPVGFFATFVIGVLAAGVTQRLKTARWGHDAVVAAALLALVILLWLLRHEPDFAFSWPQQPYYFPTFALLVGLVLAFAPASRVAGRVLDNPPARFVATVSFGLYIWHYLFLESANALFWPDLHYGGVRNVGDWLVKIGTVYGAALVVATVSWYTFEKRIVAWSQRQRI